MIDIGIDPGVSTGFAVWDTKSRALARVSAMGIIQALDIVREYAASGQLRAVYFEDARLRTGYFGERAKAKQQGAGSVKRDCKIWSELGAMLPTVLWYPVSPRAKGAKLDAIPFAKLTGWTMQTNAHGRDAAMLVYGR